MEGWLEIGKKGVLWLKTGETLLEVFSESRHGNVKNTLENALKTGTLPVPPALDTALQGAGINTAKFSTAWAELIEEVGEGNIDRFDKFIPLLSDLASQQTQTVNWPILQTDVLKDRKGAGPIFSLKGELEAELAFEANPILGLLDPINPENTGAGVTLEASQNEKFIRISAEGGRCSGTYT